MATDPLQDNFDKLSSDMEAAHLDCDRTYTLWRAACDRYDRVKKLRYEAWNELVDRIANPPPPCDHIPKKAALDDSIGCIRCGQTLDSQ